MPLNGPNCKLLTGPFFLNPVLQGMPRPAEHWNLTIGLNTYCISKDIAGKSSMSIFHIDNSSAALPESSVPWPSDSLLIESVMEGSINGELFPMVAEAAAFGTMRTALILRTHMKGRSNCGLIECMLG